MHWQLVPFEAIVLAFLVWQFLPLVIGSWSVTGKIKHNWHVGGMQDRLLNANCLLVIH